LAHRLSITNFHVIGDSKIVIGWINNKGSLQAISIDCWKDRIEELFKFFSVITFAHVYREENITADILSKKALTAHPRAIAYNKWVDGHEGPRYFLKLYYLILQWTLSVRRHIGW
jgi:hypothetical protein